MESSKFKKEIVKLVDSTLEFCEETGEYPNVCRLKQTKAGYNRIIEYVMNSLKDQGLTVQEAIAQMESSWS